ncbi:MAG: hypothetical protein AB7F35_25735 [Acetobacteraceae bacterium]
MKGDTSEAETFWIDFSATHRCGQREVQFVVSDAHESLKLPR